MYLWGRLLARLSVVNVCLQWTAQDESNAGCSFCLCISQNDFWPCVFRIQRVAPCLDCCNCPRSPHRIQCFSVFSVHGYIAWKVLSVSLRMYSCRLDLCISILSLCRNIFYKLWFYFTYTDYWSPPLSKLFFIQIFPAAFCFLSLCLCLRTFF